MFVGDTGRRAIRENPYSIVHISYCINYLTKSDLDESSLWIASLVGYDMYRYE